MGKKDITEKSLEGYNDVFADIINVLLFEGKEIVKEEELTDILPRSFYKASGEIREQERDVFKLWKNLGIRIAKIGIENQTEASDDVPIRVMGYDGAAYRDLINKDESGRYPVVTVVLYFGRTPWNKAKSLKEAISVPEELEPFVNDYKINLFEISFLTDEQVQMFRSDFRYVADYFVQVRKNNDYIPPKGLVKHVRDVLELLRVMSGDDRIAEDFVNNEENISTGGKTMGEAWLDRALEKSEKKGMEKAILGALKNGKSPEAVAEFLSIPIETVIKVQETMLTEA